jgi:polyhydroxyalkanoate synthase
VHYAEHSIGRALDVVCDQTGVRDAFVAGHSLGGTLAAIFAALHPQRVRSLIALEAPIEFSNGALETFARATPPATVTGTVPGTLLDLAAAAAAPETFGAEPLLDRMLSLPSVQATALHLRVRRWTLDELPMPARLFEEVSRELYRENRFALGTLELAGRRAHPRAIRAPILVVADPRSRIVPRSDLLAYGTRTSSTDVEFLDYRGDVGVMLQHVGVLVGANAHRQVWPRIIGWLAAHGMDRAARRS